MTDISGVERGLAYTIANLIYPNGFANSSITGRRTIIRRGWLTPDDLKPPCSLNDGIDYITVAGEGMAWRSVTWPLGNPWNSIIDQVPNLELQVIGNTVKVLRHDMEPGFCGVNADDLIYGAARVMESDTAEMIAAKLAESCGEGVQAQGNTVVFPSSISHVMARVAAPGIVLRCLRNQTQAFNVSVWSATWEGRDLTGEAVDVGMGHTWWMQCDDYSMAAVNFDGTSNIDKAMQQGIYRRDFRFAITYSTIQREASPVLLWPKLVTEPFPLSEIPKPKLFREYSMDKNGNVLENRRYV